MLRDVRYRHLGLGGESVHVARALGEEVQQLQALVAGKSCSHSRELGIEAVLEGSVAHGLLRVAVCFRLVKKFLVHLSRNHLTTRLGPSRMRPSRTEARSMTTSQANPNQVLWEKGDFTRIA